MAEENVTTQELLEFLQEHMLTKEDGENFATKDDLKAFATKDDLKAFATKDDLKEEIFSLEDKMMARFDQVDRELSDIKKDLSQLEVKTQQDDDAMLIEIEKLRQRVQSLEKVLQAKRSEIPV